jgi:hypothetical protein
MKYLTLVLCLCLLGGCVRVLPDVAKEGHRTLTLAQHPDQLYARSERTLIALGVVPSFHDAAARVLVATLPGETQPLRLVAAPSILGHTLTITGPESAISVFLPAFDAQR